VSGKRAGDESQQWLTRRTDGAPAVLRERILTYGGDVHPGSGGAESLARTAWTVVRQVAESSGDRSVALDLLAADALITLALLAEAEAQPAGLSEFAGRLLQRDAAGA
jgi:hypothetical protein